MERVIWVLVKNVFYSILAATMTITLQVAAREGVGTKANKSLRDEGMLPAVLYGPSKDATTIQVSAKEFAKVYKEAGESTVVTLDGLGVKTDVLIQEVTFEPVLGQPLHADFYVIDKNTEVEVSVPLLFTGVAPAEKQLGGTLMKVLHELQVQALPSELPHELEVSIETLATFDDQIHARDVALPKGVTLITDAEEIVALVQAPREEEEPEAGSIADVEVEKKGKEEEGE